MKISKRTVQRARYIRKRYLETFLYLSVSETLPGQKLEYLTCFFYVSSYRETNIPMKKTIFVCSKSRK